MSVLAKSLKYSQYGAPLDVLELFEDNVPAPKQQQVLVKILAAPINPADVLKIQGKYPIRPQFPAIAGGEFVGEVVSFGEEVMDLQPGTKVVARSPGLGTWTTHALYNRDQVLAISAKIGLTDAATLTVNPCTAYRMLKDFVKLSPGDTVIQNGANSAVGQAVHQMCRAWGINSVGIVRNRPEISELKQTLQDLGATTVLTEEEISTSDIFDSGKLKRPILAFNCVGGKSATEVSRHLDTSGVMVTYGVMNNEPVTIPAVDFIAKDIAFRGYWMTRWTKENYNSPERLEMFKNICEMIEEGKFVAPAHDIVPLTKFKTEAAAALSLKGFTGKKVLLDMTC